MRTGTWSRTSPRSGCSTRRPSGAGTAPRTTRSRGGWARRPAACTACSRAPSTLAPERVAVWVDARAGRQGADVRRPARRRDGPAAGGAAATLARARPGAGVLRARRRAPGRGRRHAPAAHGWTRERHWRRVAIGRARALGAVGARGGARARPLHSRCSPRLALFRWSTPPGSGGIRSPRAWAPHEHRRLSHERPDSERKPMTPSTQTTQTPLVIPDELRPADGRFGCGPSKVRPEALARLAREGGAVMGTSHRQRPGEGARRRDPRRAERAVRRARRLRGRARQRRRDRVLGRGRVRPRARARAASELRRVLAEVRRGHRRPRRSSPTR